MSRAEWITRRSNAQVKASTVKSLCAEWGVALSDTIVAGDGANDLQMMAIAGVSVGYRPKQIVAEKVDIQIAHLATRFSTRLSDAKRICRPGVITDTGLMPVCA